MLQISGHVTVCIALGRCCSCRLFGGPQRLPELKMWCIIHTMSTILKTTLIHCANCGISSRLNCDIGCGWVFLPVVGRFLYGARQFWF